MNGKQFLVVVSDEIFRIMRMATRDELNNLNIHRLQTGSGDYTVYGLLTGNYKSSRAIEISPKNMDSLSTPATYSDSQYRKGTLVTALEKYMYDKSTGTNELVFKFLKGEIKQLDLVMWEAKLTIFADSNTERPFEFLSVKPVNL